MNPKSPKTNAWNKPQSSSSSSGPRLVGDGPHEHNKYDFLEPWTATYPSTCADVDSERATEEIRKGIILVPDDGDEPIGPLKEVYLTSVADRVKEEEEQDEQEGEEREEEKEGQEGQEEQGEIRELPTSDQTSDDIVELGPENIFQVVETSLDEPKVEEEITTDTSHISIPPPTSPEVF